MSEKQAKNVDNQAKHLLEYDVTWAFRRRFHLNIYKKKKNQMKNFSFNKLRRRVWVFATQIILIWFKS